MKYKMITEELMKNIIEFLDEIQFDAAISKSVAQAKNSIVVKGDANVFIFPDLAIEPFLSYLNPFFDLILIHSSIKQLPGPISLLNILFSTSIKVALAMPPIFKIITGSGILFFLTISWWKIGTNGAPFPPFFKSFCLKSYTTVFFVIFERSFPSPSCLEVLSFALW